MEDRGIAKIMVGADGLPDNSQIRIDPVTGDIYMVNTGNLLNYLWSIEGPDEEVSMEIEQNGIIL